MAIIKLESLPHVLRFDHEAHEAERTPSNFNDTDTDYRYSCSDGFLYLPEAAHRKMMTLAPIKGKIIECCKPGRGRGANAYTFSVKETTTGHTNGNGNGHPNAKPFLDPDDSYKRAPSNAPAHYEQHPGYDPLRSEPEETPTSTRPIRQSENFLPQDPRMTPSQLAERRETKAASKAPPPEQLNRQGAKLVAAALYTAIDAITAAMKYAQDKEVDMRFSGEDARTIANTLLIEHFKRKAS
jgi:hypothetical protein